MVTYRLTIGDMGLGGLYLGTTEALAETRVLIDINEWREQFGSEGVIALTFTPPTGAAVAIPYELDGGNVIWAPTHESFYSAGIGEISIMLIAADGSIVARKTNQTIVEDVRASTLAMTRAATTAATPETTRNTLPHVIVSGRDMIIPQGIQEISVRGDSKSARVVFDVDRYFDGVDLGMRSFFVEILNPKNQYDTVIPSTEIAGDKICVTWEVQKRHTAIAGQVRVKLKVTANGDYIWQTHSGFFTVADTFDGSAEYIPEPAITLIDQALEEIDGAVQEVRESEEKMLRAIDIMQEEAYLTASAIVNKAENSLLLLDDGAERKLRKISAYGKTKILKGYGVQLFDASSVPTETIGGVAISYEGDGYIRLKGTAVGTDQSTRLKIDIPKAGAYNIKVEKEGTGGGITTLLLETQQTYPAQTITTFLNVGDSSYSLSVGSVLYFNIVSGNEYDVAYRIMVYDPAKSDGTWTPYYSCPSIKNPQTFVSCEEDTGAIEITACGKNIFDVNNAMYSSAGVGANNATAFQGISGRSVELRISPNTKYIIKKDTASVMRVATSVYRPVAGGEITSCAGLVSASNAAISITSGENDHWMCINLFVNTDEEAMQSCDVHLPSLIVVVNSARSDATYEAFKGNNARIVLNDALRSVRVAEAYDWNYVDSDGAYWMADSIEYDVVSGKLVYIKRVGYERIAGSGWTRTGTNVDRYYRAVKDTAPGADGVLMEFAKCTHFNYGYSAEEVGLFTANSSNIGFAFSEKETTTEGDFVNWLSANEVYIVYPLASPIETVLSDEEARLVSELCTHYPCTTIYASDNEFIKVEYIADTKGYIDNNPLTANFVYDAIKRIYESDKSFDEIYAASGTKVVFARVYSPLSFDDEAYYYTLSSIDRNGAVFTRTSDSGAVSIYTMDTDGKLTKSTISVSSDDHINELIDAKIGVIENGTY